MDEDTGEKHKLMDDSREVSIPMLYMEIEMGALFLLASWCLRLWGRHQLHKVSKKERQSYATANMNVTVTKEPKKMSLMSVTRLQIPNAGKGYQRLDNSPLLKLESDSDEDELFLSYPSPSPNQVNRELTRQLEKDGYHLDEIPDDEELDLIPPREFREARFCSCCNAFNITCAIM